MRPFALQRTARSAPLRSREEIDAAKLAARAGDALKKSADFFLARVHLSALHRAHLPPWRGSVHRKLTAFRDVRAVLAADAETRRARPLELVDTLLIAFEVVWARLHDR